MFGHRTMFDGVCSQNCLYVFPVCGLWLALWTLTQAIRVQISVGPDWHACVIQIIRVHFGAQSTALFWNFIKT